MRAARGRQVCRATEAHAGRGLSPRVPMHRPDLALIRALRVGEPIQNLKKTSDHSQGTFRPDATRTAYRRSFERDQIVRHDTGRRTRIPTWRGPDPPTARTV